MISTSITLVVALVLHGVTRTHPMTASLETRLPGVTRHSSSHTAATHRLTPAVRPVLSTALVHQVSACAILMLIGLYLN